MGLASWQHKLLLSLNCLSNLLLLGLCWWLLLDGQMSRLERHALRLADRLLSAEVLAELESVHTELEGQACAAVRAAAGASSALLCSGLLALTGLCLRPPAAHWLLLPHLVCGALAGCLPLLLALGAAIAQPRPVGFPLLTAQAALLLLLAHPTLLHLLHLLLLAGEGSRPVAWRRLPPDMEGSPVPGILVRQ
jgi:hypothetical protein